MSHPNIKRLHYYYLVCVKDKKSWSTRLAAMRKPCSAIPTYTSKVMHCIPQLCESTNKWEKAVPLHHMQRDSLVTHKNHTKTILRVLSCSDMRDKDFLLKIYLESHKPRVDGNTSVCASMHQHTYHYYDAICQSSNWGNRERKHMRSEKIKNSYIGYFHVCIKNDVFEDKNCRHYKSVVSCKERLFKECMNRSKCKELSCVDH